jgi:hypothetical protein
VFVSRHDLKPGEVYALTRPTFGWDLSSPAYRTKLRVGELCLIIKSKTSSGALVMVYDVFVGNQILEIDVIDGLFEQVEE